MNKKHFYLFFTALFLLLSISSNRAMASEVLNVEKHNFYTQKSLGLNNYWLFYPNEVLTGPEI